MCGDSSGGIGDAAAGRDAANNSNQSSAGVGYGGGYYGGGISGGDQGALRDAATGKVDSSFSQDVTANLETASRRADEGYSRSTRADRHGTTSGRGGLAGSTRDGIVDAAVDEGWGSLAGTVTGLLSGPALGLATKSAVDGVTAANMEADVMGTTPGVADYGRSIAQQGVNNAAPALGSKVGSTLGGRIGSAAGLPGMVAGGILGGLAGKSLAEHGLSSAPDANGSVAAAPTGSGEFTGFSGNADEASQAVASNTAETTSTGYDSSFGSYGSHNAGFKSFSADTAFNAFA